MRAAAADNAPAFGDVVASVSKRPTTPLARTGDRTRPLVTFAAAAPTWPDPT